VTGRDRTGAATGVRAWHVAALVSMVGAAWGVFAWALVAQHRAYRSNAFDLAFFDQIVWNTAHGRWFETSFVPYNFLGQHMEPVLLLYAAVYRARPDVELLLLSQAAVAALAAVPLFLAARRVLASATAGLLVAAAYLVAPHLHGAVLFDFHPEVMGAAGVFGAFALLVAGRPGWSAAALATVFLLKEDAALVGAGFALIMWLCGARRWAAGVLAASIVYLALVLGVIMPAVRGGPGDLQERYGYLGDNPREVAAGVLHRPDIVVRHLLAPAQVRALLYLLGSDAFLPLAGPAVLAAAPLLAANLLSTHPPQHGLTLHYPILAFDLLLVAAVLGIGRLTRRLGWERRASPWGGKQRRHAALTLALALFAAQAIGYMAGSPLGPVRFAGERYAHGPHEAAVRRVLARVPAGASVSAQSGLLPHLSQRRHAWEFPRLEDAAYVVVDPSAWRSSQSADAGYDEVLRGLPALGFCRLHAEDGVMLFGKGAPCGLP
jgi:uncharacterized membrane protein